MQLRSLGQSHRGLVRDHNEDSLLVMPASGLWAVADGMGGHAAGDVASRMVVDHLEAEFGYRSSSAINERQLRDSVAAANLALIDYGDVQLDGRTAGTTLVLL